MKTLLGLAAFRNAYLLRGVAAWVGVRMMLAWVQIPDPSTLEEIAVLLLVAGLVSMDARRRNEDLFLANLGVPRWPAALLGLLGALPLELWVP